MLPQPQARDAQSNTHSLLCARPSGTENCLELPEKHGHTCAQEQKQAAHGPRGMLRDSMPRLGDDVMRINLLNRHHPTESPGD